MLAGYNVITKKGMSCIHPCSRRMRWLENRTHELWHGNKENEKLQLLQAYICWRITVKMTYIPSWPRPWLSRNHVLCTVTRFVNFVSGRQHRRRTFICLGTFFNEFLSGYLLLFPDRIFGSDFVIYMPSLQNLLQPYHRQSNTSTPRICSATAARPN